MTMIPIPLATAHSMFLNWLSRTGPSGEFNPNNLTDDELRDLRNLVGEIYSDIYNGLTRLDTLAAKRAMARQAQRSPLS